MELNTTSGSLPGSMPPNHTQSSRLVSTHQFSDYCKASTWQSRPQDFLIEIYHLNQFKLPSRHQLLIAPIQSTISDVAFDQGEARHSSHFQTMENLGNMGSKQCFGRQVNNLNWPRLSFPEMAL